MSHGRYQHRHDDCPIYLCDGLLVRKCTLAGRFDGGATVHLDEKDAALPTKVVLVDPHTGCSRLVSVLWRSDAEIGLRFLEPGARYRVLRSASDMARNATSDDRSAS